MKLKMDEIKIWKDHATNLQKQLTDEIEAHKKCNKERLEALIEKGELARELNIAKYRLEEIESALNKKYF